MSNSIEDFLASKTDSTPASEQGGIEDFLAAKQAEEEPPSIEAFLASQPQDTSRDIPQEPAPRLNILQRVARFRDSFGKVGDFTAGPQTASDSPVVQQPATERSPIEKLGLQQIPGAPPQEQFIEPQQNQPEIPPYTTLEYLGNTAQLFNKSIVNSFTPIAKTVFGTADKAIAAAQFAAGDANKATATTRYAESAMKDIEGLTEIKPEDKVGTVAPEGVQKAGEMVGQISQILALSSMSAPLAAKFVSQFGAGAVAAQLPTLSKIFGKDVVGILSDAIAGSAQAALSGGSISDIATGGLLMGLGRAGGVLGKAKGGVPGEVIGDIAGGAVPAAATEAGALAYGTPEERDAALLNVGLNTAIPAAIGGIRAIPRAARGIKDAIGNIMNPQEPKTFAQMMDELNAPLKKPNYVDPQAPVSETALQDKAPTDPGVTSVEVGGADPKVVLGKEQPSFDDFDKMSREERMQVYERNPVTNRPGAPAFVRNLKIATDGFTKPIYVAIGDINGFKDFNDRILGWDGADAQNTANFDFIEKHAGVNNVSNPHGDEFFVIGDSPEDLQTKLRSAMDDIASNPVTGLDGKQYKQSFTWVIGKAKNAKEIGVINLKGHGKNKIAIDKTAGEWYNTINGSDLVAEHEIVRRPPDAPDNKQTNDGTVPKGSVTPSLGTENGLGKVYTAETEARTVETPGTAEPAAPEAVKPEGRAFDTNKQSEVLSNESGTVDPSAPVSALKSLVRAIHSLFRPRKDMPQSAFDIKNTYQHEINQSIYEMGNNNIDYKKTAIREFGKSIYRFSDQEKYLLDQALKGNISEELSAYPKTVAAIKKFRETIDKNTQTMIDKGLIKPDQVDAYTEAMGEYVNRSYQIHTNKKYKPSKPVKQRARDELALQHPDYNKNEIEGALDELSNRGNVKDYLEGNDLNNEAFKILSQRKDIPEWLRELWGENQDPLINHTQTVAKQTVFIQKKLMLKEIYEAGKKEGWLYEVSTTNEKGKHIVQLGTGKNMGDLAGKFTTKEIADSFQKQAGPMLPTYMLKILGGAKLSKTVLSSATAAANFFGNPMFLTANAAMDFRFLGKNVAVSMSNILNSGLPEGKSLFDLFSKTIGLGTEKTRELTSDLVKYGIRGEGIVSNELKAGFEGYQTSIDVAIPREYQNSYKKPIELAQKIYAEGDDFWKGMMFLAETDKYSKVFKDELSSGKMTIDEVKKIAAKNVLRGMPNYSMVGKFVRGWARNIPVLGPFISFSSESIRVLIETAKMAVEEAASSNPKIKAIGIQRIAAMTATTATPIAAALVASASVFNAKTPEEAKKKNEYMRVFVPNWDKNSVLIPIVSKNYKIRYVNTRFDPQAYSKKIVMAALKGDQSIGEAVANTVTELLGPFTAENPAYTAVVDFQRNMDKQGKPVWNKQDKPMKIWSDVARHLIDGISPGIIASLGRIKKANQGKITGSGQPYDRLSELVAMLTGFRQGVIDLRSGLEFKAMQLSRDQQDASKSNRMNGTDIGSYAIEGSLKPIREAIDAAKGLGMPDEEIFKSLKIGGMSAVDLALFKHGNENLITDHVSDPTVEPSDDDALAFYREKNLGKTGISYQSFKTKYDRVSFGISTADNKGKKDFIRENRDALGNNKQLAVNLFKPLNAGKLSDKEIVKVSLASDPVSEAKKIMNARGVEKTRIEKLITIVKTKTDRFKP